MTRIAAVVTFGLLFSLTARAEAPIVAVFQVQDKTGQLSPEDVQQLTDYLTTKLGEGGTFRTVPSGQIKERLRQQKQASYQSCYDQACQIEIGRELAAQKTVSSQIVRIGSRCAVLLTLFDLRRAAAERSSSQKAACELDQLVAALEGAADTITGRTKPKPAAKTAPATPGTLALRSKPYDADVLVDGRSVGRTPTEVSVAPGSHQVEVVARDHRPARQSVLVVAGRTVVLDFDLEPLASRPTPAAKVTAAKPPPQKVATVAKPAQTALSHRYFALLAGFRVGITEDEPNVGDFRLQIGGRRFTLQGGVHVGDALFGVRVGIVGQVPLRPWPRLPLQIIPTLGYAYTYNSIDPDGELVPDVTYHDVMIYTPGLRLRYDVARNLAVLADLVQVDISVIRIAKASNAEDWDQGFGGVQWSTQIGIALVF